ncbi:MAG: GTP-binding protein [Acidobacteriota bacterium]
MPVPVLVLVGGFLGAGKTTLLLAAAERLKLAGKRVAVILNDQGGDLVDTHTARSTGLAAEEVAGGCFCCRLSDFLACSDRLLASSDPEIILAEPVGSCTDLAATVVRPIRRFYGDRFRTAPLTVLVEPARAAELLAPEADPNLAYLFQKQIAEADIVCFSKTDGGAPVPSLPGVAARRLSAHTGEGVAGWLDEVLNAPGEAGARPLEIDYERYAEAEAALGWLNWTADLRASRALTPAAVAGPFLRDLDRGLTAAGASIAHLKVFVEAAGGWLKASVCRNGEEPAVEGALDAPPSLSHRIVLNLRAAGAPETLSEAVSAAARSLPGRVRVKHYESFRPSPPRPEKRVTEIA